MLACGSVRHHYTDYGIHILWPHALAQELLDVASDVLGRPAQSISELEQDGGSADWNSRIVHSGWGEINISMRIPLPEGLGASNVTAGRLYQRWNQYTEAAQYEDTLNIVFEDTCVHLNLCRLCMFGVLPWFAEVK